MINCIPTPPNLPSLLLLKKGTVGCNLLVQVHTDVHQLFVLMYLLLIVGSQLTQLLHQTGCLFTVEVANLGNLFFLGTQKSLKLLILSKVEKDVTS